MPRIERQAIFTKLAEMKHPPHRRRTNRSTRGDRICSTYASCCHRFYGVSQMERLPTEQAMTEQTGKFKAIAFG
jgi:hypothetical protein